MATRSLALLTLGMTASACAGRDTAAVSGKQTSCAPVAIVEGLDLPTMIGAGGGLVAYADASFIFEDADGLWVVPATGGTPEQLVDQREATTLEDRSIVRFTFDDTDLYYGWFGPPDRHDPTSLRRLAFAGGAPEIVAEGPLPAEMDADATHVYFTDELKPFVYRADKATGEVEVVTTLPSGFFTHAGVAVDDTHVYFFLHFNPFNDDQPPPFAYGRIARAPKSGGDLEVIHEFFTRRAFAEEMKLRDGLLYVAARDDSGAGVHFFAIDTATLEPRDIALDVEPVLRFDIDDDFLYVPSSRGVSALTHDGRLVAEAGLGRPGQDVAVDGDTVFYTVIASDFDTRDGQVISLSKGCFAPGSGDDLDGDGVPNAVDDCPAAADPGQEDADGDGVGDACDDCPSVPDPEQADEDDDGRGDACS